LLLLLLFHLRLCLRVSFFSCACGFHCLPGSLLEVPPEPRNKHQLCFELV
jgi:hypothetical protein